MQLNWTNILTKHPVFSLLKTDEIERLVEISTQREFSEKEMILKEGVSGESLFIIGSGRVEVFLRWTDLQNIQANTLGEGEIFGEMAVIEPSRIRSATVVASARCIVLEIAGAEFMKLLERHPRVAIQVLSIVSSRLRDVSERTFKVVFNQLEEKILALDAKIDSKFEGARVIFNHVDQRAHEIIDSAERGRSRATWLISTVSGVIATAVLVLGLFGWKEITNLSEKMNSVKDTLTRAEATADDAERIQDRLTRLLENVELEELNTIQEILQETSEKAARLIFLPRFRSVLKEYDYYTAGELYESIRKLSPAKPPIYQFLLEIEEGFISADPEKLIKTTDSYASLLRRILKDKDLSRRDEVHLYYLLWVNAILQNEAQAYEEAFSSFEDSAREYVEKTGADDLYLRPELIKGQSEKTTEAARLRLCWTLKSIFSSDRFEQEATCQ